MSFELENITIVDSSLSEEQSLFLKKNILSQIFFYEGQNLRLSPDHKIILMNNMCNLKKFLCEIVENNYISDVECIFYKLDSYSEERSKYLKKISNVDPDYYASHHIVLKETPISFYYINILCKKDNNLVKNEKKYDQAIENIDKRIDETNEKVTTLETTVDTKETSILNKLSSESEKLSEKIESSNSLLKDYVSSTLDDANKKNLQMITEELERTRTYVTTLECSLNHSITENQNLTKLNFETINKHHELFTNDIQTLTQKAEMLNDEYSIKHKELVSSQTALLTNVQDELNNKMTDLTTELKTLNEQQILNYTTSLNNIAQQVSANVETAKLEFMYKNDTTNLEVARILDENLKMDEKIKLNNSILNEKINTVNVDLCTKLDAINLFVTSKTDEMSNMIAENTKNVNTLSALINANYEELKNLITMSNNTNVQNITQLQELINNNALLVSNKVAEISSHVSSLEIKYNEMYSSHERELIEVTSVLYPNGRGLQRL